MSDSRGVLRRLTLLLILAVTLSSCSYGYDILAVARGGRLMFIINPASAKRPSCLREIEVTAERPVKAKAGAGDDATRVGYGTYWFESVSYDDACANEFPLPYGAELGGEHQQDGGIVRPKPLLREVIYEVTTTSGATGYGSGRFIIHADGRVENLPVQGSPLDASNMLENAG